MQARQRGEGEGEGEGEGGSRLGRRGLTARRGLRASALPGVVKLRRRGRHCCAAGPAVSGLGAAVAPAGEWAGPRPSGYTVLVTTRTPPGRAGLLAQNYCPRNGPGPLEYARQSSLSPGPGRLSRPRYPGPVSESPGRPAPLADRGRDRRSTGYC